MISTNNILLLASSSPSRQMLLENAGIPFSLITQSADEQVTACQLTDTVLAIAHQKMAHVILPDNLDISRPLFILTADTLVQNKEGRIQGKPTDIDDAVRMVKEAREGLEVSTAFCLQKRVWQNNAWVVAEQHEEIVNAHCVVDIADNLIIPYIQKANTMRCAGAIAIEKLGSSFLKSVSGSYSTIIGLPLFEVRQALTKMGFFE